MTATYNFAMIREILEILQSKIVEIKREICNIQEKLEIVSYVIEDFENFQKKENIGTSENYEIMILVKIT